jgi:hypothetical protein
MNVKRGDVIKRLVHGVCPEGAHPVVILHISGEMMIFSNITDIEKEDFVHCVLELEDDPKIITKRSTFRYQDIMEDTVLLFNSAIEKGNMRNCGQLAPAAFGKIITGSQLAENVNIKPKYRTILKPAPTTVVAPRPTPNAEI